MKFLKTLFAFSPLFIAFLISNPIKNAITDHERISNPPFGILIAAAQDDCGCDPSADDYEDCLDECYANDDTDINDDSGDPSYTLWDPPKSRRNRNYNSNYNRNGGYFPVYGYPSAYLPNYGSSNYDFSGSQFPPGRSSRSRRNDLSNVQTILDVEYQNQAARRGTTPRTGTTGTTGRATSRNTGTNYYGKKGFGHGSYGNGPFKCGPGSGCGPLSGDDGSENGI